MRSSAIIRIICYSLVILLLVGLLLIGLGINNYTFRKAQSSDTVLNESSVSAQDISEMEIEWAAGSVTILTADTDQITFAESGEFDNRYAMVCQVVNNTLQLEYAASTITVGIGSMPSKDLTITVPADWHCQSLEIDGAALEIDIADLSVGTIELDGAATELDFNGSLDNLECDGAACELRLVCQTNPRSINLDGASCELDLTLPKDCGFRAVTEGLACGFEADCHYTSSGGVYTYGDGACGISVDGMSCQIRIQANNHHPE